MWQELIAIILVILIINIFLIFAIKNVSNRVSDYMKKCFIDGVKVYDTLIEEKQKQLYKINEEILDLKKEENIDEKKDKNYTSKPNGFASIDITEYEDEHFFSNYLLIKNNFNINYKDLVKDFVFYNFEKDKDMYNLYSSIFHKINLNIYYMLLKHDYDERESILKKILDEKEIIIVDEYIKINGKFDLVDFYNHVRRSVKLLNPEIVIKGNKNHEYLETVDNRIRFELDNNIIEGIKILYKGKIFDYSL